MKVIVFMTEMLIKPSKGIGLRTYFYSDGTKEQYEFSMCKIPKRINLYELL